MRAFSAAATLTVALSISTGTAQNATTGMVGGTAGDRTAITDDGNQVVRIWPEGGLERFGD